jgi:hypothetical protein
MSIRFRAVLLLVVLGLFTLSPLFFRGPASFAIPYGNCATDSLESAIETGMGGFPNDGSCAANGHGIPASDCFEGGGSLNPDQAITDDSGTDVPGYYTSCDAKTTSYSWDGNGNAQSGGGDDGYVTVRASSSAGGFQDVTSGEWNTFVLSGSCPGYTDLSHCIKIVWLGDLDTFVPSGSSAQVNWEAFIVEDYETSTSVVTAQICCGSSQTQHLSGSETLASLVIPASSRDDITIGQDMLAQASGIASVNSQAGVFSNLDQVTISLEVTGCPSTNPNCVTITPLVTPPLPTPVFPFGTILALITPLAALALFALVRLKMLPKKGFLANFVGEAVVRAIDFPIRPFALRFLAC